MMYDELQKKLHYRFKNRQLLERALDRRIYKAENKKNTRPFESFEFVGDRVLNLCIATIIAELHPDWTPSQLQPVYIRFTRNTNDAAKNGGPLYRIAKYLELESHLLCTEDEVLDKAGKRGKLPNKKKKTKEGILSDHVEALISAIYQDASYNLQIVIPIVKHLFTPLGLLDSDHISVSNFGESQSLPSDDMTEAMTVQHQTFIQSVSAGNLSEFKKINYVGINTKTATYGLLIALTNKFHHMVPYLAKQYTIDLHMVREALEDPELDLSTRGFFNRFLIEQLLIKHKEHLLDDADKEDLFLRLVEQGKMVALKEAALTPTMAVIQQAFFLALRENKPDMIVVLVKEYGIDLDVIQDALNTHSMSANTQRFLEKRIQPPLSPASFASLAMATHTGVQQTLSPHSPNLVAEMYADAANSFISVSSKSSIEAAGFFGERSREGSIEQEKRVETNNHNAHRNVTVDTPQCCTIQ